MPKSTATKPSSNGARSSLDDRCAAAFTSWAKKNRIRKPTGQDVARFFTERVVRSEFPCAMGYAQVWDILKAARAFDG